MTSNAKNLYVNNVQPSSYIYQDQESVPAGEICLPVYTPRTAPDLHLHPTYQRSVVQLFLLAVHCSVAGTRHAPRCTHA